jgi:hypothetical protein
VNLIFALLFLLQVGAVAATEPDPEFAAESEAIGGIKGADLDLLGEVRRIATNVEGLREQRFDRPPLAVRVEGTMRDVAATIRAYGILPREQVAARGRAWADLGLGTELSPSILMRVLATDLADVAFDPSANRLLVSPDRLTVQDFEAEGDEDPTTVLMMTGVRPDEPLVSHLLAHVRQRERLGRDPLRPTTDEALAGMAWAEGEANLVAIRYLFEGMGLSDDILEHRLDPGSFLDGTLLPSGLSDLSPVDAWLIDFVYLDGFDFAVAEFRSGGWSALDEAMDLRRSTRQLLHPDRDAPRNDFARPEVPADGLALVDEDTLGEQAIVVLIAWATEKDNLGLLAADGWAGGRVYRWEPPGEGTDGVTEWVTRWDTPEARKDFSYSFARALTTRFPGKTMVPVADGVRRLDAGGRVYLLEEGETEVRVRVSHPDWAGPSPAAE